MIKSTIDFHGENLNPQTGMESLAKLTSWPANGAVALVAVHHGFLFT